MNFFSDYLYSILAVGILSFLCEVISCGKRTSPALTKGLSLVTSLCILITVISPIFSGFKSIGLSKIKTEIKNEVISENYFLSLCEDETEKILHGILEGICSISEIDVSLIEKDDGTTDIKHISITIKDNDKAIEKELINAVKNAAGEETKVIINVEG